MLYVTTCISSRKQSGGSCGCVQKKLAKRDGVGDGGGAKQRPWGRIRINKEIKIVKTIIYLLSILSMWAFRAGWMVGT